jgi:hypothetical protein
MRNHLRFSLVAVGLAVSPSRTVPTVLAVSASRRPGRFPGHLSRGRMVPTVLAFSCALLLWPSGVLRMVPTVLAFSCGRRPGRSALLQFCGRPGRFPWPSRLPVCLAASPGLLLWPTVLAVLLPWPHDHQSARPVGRLAFCGQPGRTITCQPGRTVPTMLAVSPETSGLASKRGLAWPHVLPGRFPGHRADDRGRLSCADGPGLLLWPSGVLRMVPTVLAFSCGRRPGRLPWPHSADGPGLTCGLPSRGLAWPHAVPGRFTFPHGADHAGR